MIEVEVKYKINETIKNRLLKTAQFVDEITIRDVYYDDSDFSLMKKDYWLRERNGSFELKVPPKGGGASRNDTSGETYLELEDVSDIADELGINDQYSLKDSILEHGYVPFGTIVTKRLKYKIGDKNLDFDYCDFGYEVLEVEKMVDDVSEIDKAKKDIADFASRYGLDVRVAKGKVLEFMEREHPESFRRVTESWKGL